MSWSETCPTWQQALALGNARAIVYGSRHKVRSSSGYDNPAEGVHIAPSWWVYDLHEPTLDTLLSEETTR